MQEVFFRFRVLLTVMLVAMTLLLVVTDHSEADAWAPWYQCHHSQSIVTYRGYDGNNYGTRFYYHTWNKHYFFNYIWTGSGWNYLSMSWVYRDSRGCGETLPV